MPLLLLTEMATLRSLPLTTTNFIFTAQLSPLVSIQVAVIMFHYLFEGRRCAMRRKPHSLAVKTVEVINIEDHMLTRW